MLWVVVWEHKVTRAKGRGEPTDYATARAWADAMNREHPDIWHWLELASDLEAAEATP